MVQAWFLFPGQGSQKIGMGEDLYDKFSVVKDTFEEASDTLGKDMVKLMFKGSQEELNKTINAQPATLISNIAYQRVLQEMGVEPIGALGHSAGEYAALVTAGVITYQEALEIIQKRAEFMTECIPKEKSSNGATHMAAIINRKGIDYEKLETMMKSLRSHGLVELANYNTDRQVVITGNKLPLHHAKSQSKEYKTGLLTYLSVEGPFHSTMMSNAGKQLRDYMRAYSFKDPQITFISNVEGEPEDVGFRIQMLAAKQVCQPVKWRHSIDHILAEDKNAQFIEAGDSSILEKMISSSYKDAKFLDKKQFLYD